MGKRVLGGRRQAHPQASSEWTSKTMIEPKTKPIASLQISDLEKHPLWQFAIDDEAGDTAVQSLKRLPVSTLAGKIVGRHGPVCQRRISGGGTVCNLDARNPEMNEHFLTLSIERNRRWFHLQREVPPGVAVPSTFNEPAAYIYKSVLCRKQFFHCAG